MNARSSRSAAKKSPLTSPGSDHANPASPKIQPYHLLRQAIVYVRQSSPQQVAENRESSARQYALVDRAVALGWPRDRVLVIDEDQGRSGATVEGRLGFQRLLAEVGLDHVGLILGLEMSRLARSCKDWHQLLELCAIFRTLLADQDGLYDPTDHNDRLLLGLTGIMCEAELHILRGRMLNGLLNKARRGELFSQVPIGYLKLPGSGLVIDPDEQAQAVVRLIFDQFDRLGSLQGVLRYLVRNGIRIPFRPHYGPNRGQLEWRRPVYGTLRGMLHHPIYAGYYRWGHSTLDPKRRIPGRSRTGRTTVAASDNRILIEGRCPAYITPKRFWANQERLAANQCKAQGACREGASLLGGLLVCGRCDRRMVIQYAGKRKNLRYLCNRAKSHYADTVCLNIAGSGLDAFVTDQVLAALQPAALELSLAAAADWEAERQRLERHWHQQLERAQYEVDRAARSYQAVEPENRLVSRELERRWEAALRDQQVLEEEFARFRRQQPGELTEAQRQQIRLLSQDVPALWHAPTTSWAERQQIVRMLIEQVVIRIEGQSEQAQLAIRWAGGFTSQHAFTRSLNCYERRSDFGDLCQRIAALREQGLTLAAVAERLNIEGIRPLKRRTGFTEKMVADLLAKHVSPRSTKQADGLKADEWLLGDLARQVGMPTVTLRLWIRWGWVHARKLPMPNGPWAIWADDEELARMRQLRQCSRASSAAQSWRALTTPKPRGPA